MAKHDTLLNAKIFKIHFRNNSAIDNTLYSLLDFCSMEGLETRQFYTADVLHGSDELTYYEIKKQILKTGTKEL